MSLHTVMHIGIASDGKRVHEEPTVGKPVYPPALASCPGAPVCIALGDVLSLDVSLHHVLIKRHSSPSLSTNIAGAVVHAVKRRTYGTSITLRTRRWNGPTVPCSEVVLAGFSSIEGNLLELASAALNGNSRFITLSITT